MCAAEPAGAAEISRGGYATAGTRSAVTAPPLILPNRERQVSDAGLVAVEYV